MSQGISLATENGRRQVPIYDDSHRKLINYEFVDFVNKFTVYWNYRWQTLQIYAIKEDGTEYIGEKTIKSQSSSLDLKFQNLFKKEGVLITHDKKATLIYKDGIFEIELTLGPTNSSVQNKATLFFIQRINELELKSVEARAEVKSLTDKKFNSEDLEVLNSILLALKEDGKLEEKVKKLIEKTEYQQ